MNKTTLIAYMESQKTKINTDEFISAIFESRPDMMELERNTPDGGVYDLSGGNNNSKSNEETQEHDTDEENKVGDLEGDDGDEIGDDEDTEIEESESVDEDSDEEFEDVDEPLNIIDNSGYKQVAFNDAFENITEDKYPQISDIFTPNAIKLIIASEDSDWEGVNRKLIMCNEKDYNSEKEKMSCYNSSNPTGMGRPNIFKRQYIDKYYKASYSGKLKDANARFIIFTPKDNGESIELIDISPKQNGVTFAIDSKLSNESESYLMKGSKLHVEFLFGELVREDNMDDTKNNFTSETLEVGERINSND